MAAARSGGILLHPTSLPGPHGIGSLGRAAYEFVDTLVASGLSLWQVLPLGPTGYGDSPYASLSAFAGNPLLIDLDPLRARDLLVDEDLGLIPHASPIRVDFGAVVPTKMTVLRRAFDRLSESEEVESGFEEFCRVNQRWLDELVLYMAIKEEHGGVSWTEWDPALRSREDTAMSSARSRLERTLQFHRWVQFLFFQQWDALKQYANERGVRIVGDIPIFVAHDSADVWSNQHLFRLHPDGNPEVVAGVPPDYFSATGQLWGNPHYRWDVMQADGFRWWVDRFRVLLRLVDIVRLDHFRGFAAAWAVPFGHQTAEHGTWEPSPGAMLFSTLRSELSDLPIIAEDLGVITPDVEHLRDTFGFPGMHILQFAFGSGASNPSLPHNLEHNVVVYTGTHDNDTTVGWYVSLSEEDRASIRTYLKCDGLDISWDLIRAAFASVADTAIVPLQDVLRLGTASRMNLPGQPAGNWAWRFAPGDITPLHVQALRSLSEIYGRVSVQS